MDYPRRELLQNVAGRENICINLVRQTKDREWKHVLVSDKPSPAVYVEIKDGSSVFPLYLFRPEGKHPNFNADFSKFISERFDAHFSPEEIFGYLYGVMYAPSYRLKYAEFLRQDFPRIPFPEEASGFETLSKLGWELVQAHLLKDYPDAGLGKFDGKGDDVVEAVRYSEAEKAIWINKTQCFKPVPEDVWNFHIGGYQVLEKYLKSRKGRQLSLDEMKHVGHVADSLAFTIVQMEKIDKAYKKAFPDRG
jgi:predicted helicase